MRDHLHRLGFGNRFIFHQTDLISQLPRQFHRFTCRQRLPKFILGFAESTSSSPFYFLRIMVFLSCFPARSSRVAA